MRCLHHCALISVIIDHGMKIDVPAALLVQNPPERNRFRTEANWSSADLIVNVAVEVVEGNVLM
jgi:hypothetical protein